MQSNFSLTSCFFKQIRKCLWRKSKVYHYFIFYILFLFVKLCHCTFICCHWRLFEIFFKWCANFRRVVLNMQISLVHSNLWISATTLSQMSPARLCKHLHWPHYHYKDFQILIKNLITSLMLCLPQLVQWLFTLFSFSTHMPFLGYKTPFFFLCTWRTTYFL